MSKYVCPKCGGLLRSVYSVEKEVVLDIHHTTGEEKPSTVSSEDRSVGLKEILCSSCGFVKPNNCHHTLFKLLDLAIMDEEEKENFDDCIPDKG